MNELHKNTRIYYSHSKTLYNTEREREELEFLKSVSDKVICPNCDIGNCQKGMKAYLNIVKWADLVVVSLIEDKLTSGVQAEVRHALKLNIPIKKLVDKTFVDFTDNELP